MLINFLLVVFENQIQFFCRPRFFFAELSDHNCQTANLKLPNCLIRSWKGFSVEATCSSPRYLQLCYYLNIFTRGRNLTIIRKEAKHPSPVKSVKKTSHFWRHQGDFDAVLDASRKLKKIKKGLCGGVTFVPLHYAWEVSPQQCLVVSSQNLEKWRLFSPDLSWGKLLYSDEIFAVTTYLYPQKTYMELLLSPTPFTSPQELISFGSLGGGLLLYLPTQNYVYFFLPLCPPMVKS